MSTSERNLLRHLTGQLCVAAFFAVFGEVYERFSHEVYSYYMLYAFTLPLLLCALPYSILLQRKVEVRPAILRLWDAAVLTWTVGSVCKGVLEIYGTTNSLIWAYSAAGGVLALIAMLLCMKQRPAAKQPE